MACFCAVCEYDLNVSALFWTPLTRTRALHLRGLVVDEELKQRILWEMLYKRPGGVVKRSFFSAGQESAQDGKLSVKANEDCCRTGPALVSLVGGTGNSHTALVQMRRTRRTQRGMD
jgi:hypothetical protein